MRITLDCLHYLMFIGPCIIAIVDEWKTNLMSLAILFHLLCAQHVSDINVSIFRSLRLCWWITTSVVLFSVRCVWELLLRLVFGGVHFAGWSTTVLQPAKRTPLNTSRNKSSNTLRTEKKTTDVVIHQHSRKLLKMDTLMSETCWAHNKWNKIASDIKLVFHSSIIIWDSFTSSGITDYHKRLVAVHLLFESLRLKFIFTNYQLLLGVTVI